LVASFSIFLSVLQLVEGEVMMMEGGDQASTTGLASNAKMEEIFF
jgi:hypothetical protein